MENKLIVNTKQFVKAKFIEHPHHSFNDWNIMYNHSIKVYEIAMQLAKNVSCDETVVALSALLHDIGKTYPADAMTLHKKHEEFNVLIARPFIEQVNLSEAQRELLEETLLEKSNSTEAKIVRDADILAFYADKKLHFLFLKWAQEKNLPQSIEKKLNNYSKLHFEQSKTMGKKWFDEMKREWNQEQTT